VWVVGLDGQDVAQLIFAGLEVGRIRGCLVACEREQGEPEPRADGMDLLALEHLSQGSVAGFVQAEFDGRLREREPRAGISRVGGQELRVGTKRGLTLEVAHQLACELGRDASARGEASRWSRGSLGLHGVARRGRATARERDEASERAELATPPSMAAHAHRAETLTQFKRGRR
jgi:hypothetical protein